ncbi:SWR1 complex subunit 2 [Olea europaea subsp. europaea]|uniref:SWR1 complex subunit 2 n=1 Tax=Olea europaea subsp. europaea TaxID=158383 RepID=A0A8S0TBA6_OLEEU|nr:SWR1 complex subunit 2 [Olea europaea subsp. europaea]
MRTRDPIPKHKFCKERTEVEVEEKTGKNGPLSGFAGGNTKEEIQLHVFLDHTSRLTRGKRMTKLLNEEIKEDETFWNQEALKEEENDVEYEEEAEVADVNDSDFDEDISSMLL